MLEQKRDAFNTNSSNPRTNLRYFNSLKSGKAVNFLIFTASNPMCSTSKVILTKFLKERMKFFIWKLSKNLLTTNGSVKDG